MTFAAPLWLLWLTSAIGFASLGLGFVIKERRYGRALIVAGVLITAATALATIATLETLTS